jgi:uncharacterized protein (TIGR02246 family)
MNTPKRSAVLAAAFLALTGCQPPPQDTTADEAVIRQSAPAWAAAFNAGDADALAAMYWDDAVLQPPGAPSATGRAAIREFLAADSAAARAAGMTMNIPEAGAVDVSGDLAYEAGTYSVTDSSGATVDTGKYIGVFQKRDGKWLYIRDTWNSDIAPAPAEAPAAEPAAEPPAEAAGG